MNDEQRGDSEVRLRCAASVVHTHLDLLSTISIFVLTLEMRENANLVLLLIGRDALSRPERSLRTRERSTRATFKKNYYTRTRARRRDGAKM